MAARFQLVLVPALMACAGLAACTTPRSQPVLSKAVIAAREHKDLAAAAAEACPTLTSPQSIGFPFQDSTLKDVGIQPLEALARGLACHPQLQAVIVGAADAHGTAEEQAKLARDRAQTLADYLRSKGIAPARLQIAALVQGKPPVGDAQHLIIMAEGRRF